MTKPAATWSLHLPKWPKIDRAAWNRALADGDWLDNAGPGARLRPKTRAKYAEGYGHWLAWLSDEGLLNPGWAPADRVTPERLIAYVNWMRNRVAPATMCTRIQDLKLTLALIDPTLDAAFFQRILDRLPKAPSRDKRRQFRDPADLSELGEALMRAAEQGEFGPPRYNAVAFRDGLMIALAAWRPLRRANLAGLWIGQHLRTRSGSPRIVIPPEETKTRRHIDMPWPREMRPALGRYLAHWRPILLGSHDDPGALWISRRGGRPISAHTLACNFRRHTEAAFGVAISPHRFRDAAATMMALRDPANVRAAAAVLGHRSYKMTQKHYNLARQLDAVGALHEGIEAMLIDKETQ